MNIFSVLDSDEDEEIVTPPTPPPQKPNRKAVVESKTTDVKDKPQPNAVPSNRKASSGPQTVSSDAVDAEASKPTNRGEGRDGHHRVERGGRGRGGRGGAERDGDGQPRKREYERHSGTGRGREVSKGGSGSHNWGNEKTEAQNAEKSAILEGVAAEDSATNADVAAALAEAAGESSEPVPEAAGWGADPTPAPEATPVPEPEPEPVTYTLDEYLASKAQVRANAELFGSVLERTVNEEDYAGLKTKVADTEEFVVLGGNKNNKTKKGEQRSNAAKSNTVVDVGFKTAPVQSGRDDNRRGGRGGRGRGEGRGEGRGGRGGGFDRPRDSGPRRSSGGRGGIDINDSSAFPSL